MDLDEGNDIPDRLRVNAIVVRVTGALSLVGSAWIVRDILPNRKKRARVYDRILLGMSSADVLQSSACVVSTWLVPRGSPLSYGAAGNGATCNLQGFFLQAALATPLYNSCLALYYLLLLKCGWREGKIAKLAERWMHAVALSLSLGTAFAGLGLELYNPLSFCCWIAPLPLSCNQSYKNGGESTCVRGDNASLYQFLFFHVWLWIAVLSATVYMVLVYRAVLRTERRSRRYALHNAGRSDSDTTRSSGGRVVRNKKSRRVAKRGMMYLGAFYLTWIFVLALRAVEQRVTHAESFYPLKLLVVIFFPLQGFLNFLIYMRPRYRKYFREHPGWPLRRVACRNEQNRVDVEFEPGPGPDEHKDRKESLTSQGFITEETTNGFGTT